MSKVSRLHARIAELERHSEGLEAEIETLRRSVIDLGHLASDRLRQIAELTPMANKAHTMSVRVAELEGSSRSLERIEATCMSVINAAVQRAIDAEARVAELEAELEDWKDSATR